MVEGRVILKKISVSGQVSVLPIEGQLLFVLMIVHADDVGLLPIDPATIKAMVIPLVDMPIPKVKDLLEIMKINGLIEEIKIENTLYLRLKKFGEMQKLRRDLYPHTILPMRNGKKLNWNDLEAILANKIISIRPNPTESDRILPNPDKVSATIERLPIIKLKTLNDRGFEKDINKIRPNPTGNGKEEKGKEGKGREVKEINKEKIPPAKTIPLNAESFVFALPKKNDAANNQPPPATGLPPPTESHQPEKQFLSFVDLPHSVQQIIRSYAMLSDNHKNQAWLEDQTQMLTPQAMELLDMFGSWQDAMNFVISVGDNLIKETKEIPTLLTIIAEAHILAKEK